MNVVHVATSKLLIHNLTAPDNIQQTWLRILDNVVKLFRCYTFIIVVIAPLNLIGDHK